MSENETAARDASRDAGPRSRRVQPHRYADAL